MKTSIKLVLIYFLMQLLGVAVAAPLILLYFYIVSGTIDPAAAEPFMLAPTMLLGFLFMTVYLWKKGYLKNDKQLYSPISPAFLTGSLVAGVCTIFLIDFAMSHLRFLPDWMSQAFDLLQTGWLGIACIALLAPILEELLFRGAITKILLKKYNPTKAIVLSALIFGIFHLNPVQIVGATLVGLLLGWLYYKTQSLVPVILIHILNNSLSVWLNLSFPEVEYTSDLLGAKVYLICLAVAVPLFLLSIGYLHRYKLTTSTITETNL